MITRIVCATAIASLFFPRLPAIRRNFWDKCVLRARNAAHADWTSAVFSQVLPGVVRPVLRLPALSWLPLTPIFPQFSRGHQRVGTVHPLDHTEGGRCPPNRTAADVTARPWERLHSSARAAPRAGSKRARSLGCQSLASGRSLSAIGKQDAPIAA